MAAAREEGNAAAQAAEEAAARALEEAARANSAAAASASSAEQWKHRYPTDTTDDAAHVSAMSLLAQVGRS